MAMYLPVTALSATRQRLRCRKGNVKNWNVYASQKGNPEGTGTGVRLYRAVGWAGAGAFTVVQLIPIFNAQ